MKKILDIINPCRILKVEEWMEISFLNLRGFSHRNTPQHYRKFQQFIQRFEQLTSQPILKEMFVNELQKPTEQELKIVAGVPSGNCSPEFQQIIDRVKEYNEAQSKVWFAGFEKVDETYFQNGEYLDIYWQEEVSFELVGAKGYVMLPANPTVLDLLIEIDRYNQTAKEPIKLKFHENFVKALIQ